MQTGSVDYRSPQLRFESRQVESICAGFRQESTRSAFGRDLITIQGVSQDTATMKNPQFLAVLEETRIASLL